MAVGATSSIVEMAPPIRGLALANLRDTFEELHDGNKHEAIDIMEPKGTPVHAIVAGTIRKLFFSKPGGNTINADSRTPHLHFAIFELGPKRLWWQGKAVNPYPGLVAAMKRAK